MELTRRTKWAALGGILLATAVSAADSSTGPADRFESRPVPGSIEQLRLAAPLQAPVLKLDPSLLTAQGVQTVIVRLKTPAVADVNRVPEAEVDYDRDGARVSRRLAIDAEQREFVGRILSRAPGAAYIESRIGVGPV